MLQFLTANFHGPTLVDVVGGLGSLVALTVFLRFWQPKEVWRFADEAADARRAGVADAYAPAKSFYAWMPWVLLSVLVFVWGTPQLRTVLDGGDANESQRAARYRQAQLGSARICTASVFRTAPVAPVASGSDRAREAETAVYEFKWLSATGTGIFLAAVLIGLLAADFAAERSARKFVDTLGKMRWALLTIACMLALAYVTKYSGSDATLGLAFTKTGLALSVLRPAAGLAGRRADGLATRRRTRCSAACSESRPSSSGSTRSLIVASNSTGGVMGKMIDAQSIVVAAVATEQTGGEGKILRFVFFHSVALAVLVGLLTLAQAYRRALDGAVRATRRFS